MQSVVIAYFRYLILFVSFLPYSGDKMLQVCLVRKEENSFWWVAEVDLRSQTDGGELKPLPFLDCHVRVWNPQPTKHWGLQMFCLNSSVAGWAETPDALAPNSLFQREKGWWNLITVIIGNYSRILRRIWKPVFLSYFWIAIEWIISIPIIKMMCWQWNLAVLYLISNWWNVFLGLTVVSAAPLCRDLQCV